MSSLSLQDNIGGPPPPVYLYTVKIENFRHTLMSSLKDWQGSILVQIAWDYCWTVKSWIEFAKGLTINHLKGV